MRQTRAPTMHTPHYIMSLFIQSYVWYKIYLTSTPYIHDIGLLILTYFLTAMIDTTNQLFI